MCDVEPRVLVSYIKILNLSKKCSYGLYRQLQQNVISCLFKVPDIFVRFYTNKGLLYKFSCSQYQCGATNRKVAGSIPARIIGFFIDINSFRSHYGPGVDSASNRNDYQQHFLGGVKAVGA